MRVVLGTSRHGYELSWVRVVLGLSRLGYELSWVRDVLGTSCPQTVLIYVVSLLCVYMRTSAHEDFGVRSRYLRQVLVIASHGICVCVCVVYICTYATFSRRLVA